jgi:hypothetical protein
MAAQFNIELTDEDLVEALEALCLENDLDLQSLPP